MNPIPILTAPHPVLSTPTKEVTKFGGDGDVLDLIADMFRALQAHGGGLALAANQIGDSRRVCVVDVTFLGLKMPFINPTIVSVMGEVECEEGCLSLPGITKVMKRARRLTVRAYDVVGKRFELDVSGIVAIALQHEIDHLDGKLIND